MYLAIWMPIDDFVEDIGRVGKRIDIVQLASLDQGGDHCPMLGTAVGACEQRIFPIEGDRTDRAFDGILVEFDTAIIDEARQSLPTDWVGHAAWHLRPLHERLLVTLRQRSKLFADETTVPVLDPGRGRTKTGQLWTYAVDDRPWSGRRSAMRRLCLRP